MKEIRQSVGGELRVEAEEENGEVCFKTYVLNTLVNDLTLTGEPVEKLSSKGFAAYYATRQVHIKTALKAKISSTTDQDRIIQEFIADLE